MTAQERVQVVQREAMPHEDLSRFEGAWVALRHGHVVAAAADPVDLRAHPAVHRDDALMPVPPDGGRLLIA